MTRPHNFSSVVWKALCCRALRAYLDLNLSIFRVDAELDTVAPELAKEADVETKKDDANL